jgi:hypothetical protein
VAGGWVVRSLREQGYLTAAPFLVIEPKKGLAQVFEEFQMEKRRFASIEESLKT